MGNTKTIKQHLISKFINNHTSLSAIILTGVMFGTLNVGTHFLLQNYKEFNLQLNQQITNSYSENNLNKILSQEDKKVPIEQKLKSFSLMPFYASSNYIYTLQMLKEKEPRFDIKNEKQVLADIEKNIPKKLKSVTPSLIYYYEHSDKNNLSNAINAYDNVLNFYNQINRNLNAKTSSVNNNGNNEMKKESKNVPIITEEQKNQYIQSIQVLNKFNQKFIDTQYNYELQQINSFDNQTAFLMISLVFSFIFWTNRKKDSSENKKIEKRKLVSFMYHKLDTESKRTIKKIYQEIKQRTNLPQNSFSKKQLFHFWDVSFKNGINLNAINFKKQNINKLDKFYLSLLPVTLSLNLLNHFNISDLFSSFSFVFVAATVALINNVEIYNQQHIKKYILTNYHELSQHYPEEVLKIFLDEPSDKVIKIIENYNKQNHKLNLMSIFKEFEEEQKSNYNQENVLQVMNEKILPISENKKKYLTHSH